MFVENTDPDLISLDSSVEEPITPASRDDEVEEVAEIKTKMVNSIKESIHSKELETDKDEIKQETKLNNQDRNATIESIDVKDLDSSDTEEEFEEVPEVEDNSHKPVVELTLKVGDIPNDEDDIFADVFSPSVDSVSHIAPTNSILGTIVPKKEPNDNENKCQFELVPEDNAKSLTKVIQPIGFKESDVLPKDQVDEVKTSLAPKEPILEVTKDSTFKTQPESQKDNSSNSATESNIESTSKNDLTTNNEESANNNKSVEANKAPKTPLTNEKLNSMVEEIQNEEQDLIQEKGRLDRIGRNITEQMTKEAQELLQIFGIPYIVAPMEAEAQCAFLESVNLTDGTITDDSDIWLFGGQTVYKNFFNQKKHVLQYISERIEKSFNLNREQLILLALLVGSDYTTGVAGVGPVTAMEILASFPFNKKQVLAETSKQVRYAKLLDGLKEFKLWVKAGKRTDNTTLKKKLRNVTLSDDFPSARVIQAYLEPNVEKSEENFSWGELDITVLRDYAKSKFGWSQQKFDEIIKPVLARMKDRKNQKTVHDYFKRKVEFQSLEEQMSKRVKAAVQKMGPGDPGAETTITEEESAKNSKKRRNVRKSIENAAGPSKPKQRKKQEVDPHVVQVVTEIKDGKTGFEINIPKTERFQEIIPQREKDKQHLLENKMKAIEIFRKTTIDRKRKPRKKKPNLPKDKADLSESSSD